MVKSSIAAGPGFRHARVPGNGPEESDAGSSSAYSEAGPAYAHAGEPRGTIEAVFCRGAVVIGDAGNAGGVPGRRRRAGYGRNGRLGKRRSERTKSFLNKFGLAFGNTWFAAGSGSLLKCSDAAVGQSAGKLLTNVRWGYGQTVTKTQANNPLVEIAVYGISPAFRHCSHRTRCNRSSALNILRPSCIGDLNDDGIVDDADCDLSCGRTTCCCAMIRRCRPGVRAISTRDGMVDDADFSIFQPYDLPIYL